MQRTELTKTLKTTSNEVLAVELVLSGDAKNKRIRLIWAILLLIGFPVAIGLPFINILIIQHVSLEKPVSFDFTAALLSASSILFGFTSLIIISKEWVERKIWAVIMPPLALIILSGVEIGNLALGLENPVSALLISSAAFNANVVSTGLVVGYVVQRLNQLKKKRKVHHIKAEN